jgi:hypothetical protein
MAVERKTQITHFDLVIWLKPEGPQDNSNLGFFEVPPQQKH